MKIKSSLFWFPFFLVFYETCLYLSNDAYLPSLPMISHELSVNASQVQLSITSWYFGSAVLQLFIGPLTDRYGRRPVLLIGGVCFMLSTLGCALSQSIHSLIIWRFIEGATVATLYIAGYATIHELLPFEQAIHLLAIMGSVTILAPSFGPLLGAITLTWLSWRWIFVCLAVLSAMLVLGLAHVMPETLKVPIQPSRRKIALTYYSLLSNSRYVFRNLLGACLFAALITWITAGPFLLMNYYGFSPYHFGVWQALIFGSFIVGTRCVKLLMKHLQINTILSACLSLSVIGAIYALIFLHAYPNHPIHCLITMSLIAGGTGVIFPIINRLAIEASQEPMGYRMALGSTIFCLFGSLTSFLTSQWHAETPENFSILIAISISAAALCFKKSRVLHLKT